MRDRRAKVLRYPKIVLTCLGRIGVVRPTLPVLRKQNLSFRDGNLRKGGQLHEVVIGNALDRMASLAPRCEAPGDDVDFES